MVRGVPGFGLLVPLVHGEVGDPEEFEVGGGVGLLEELVLVGELLGELEAESCRRACRSTADRSSTWPVCRAWG